MSIEERIISALSDIVAVIQPNIYTGDSLEYIVFNYDEIQAYAEGTSYATRCLIQIHWFLPHKANPRTKKASIAQALEDIGFTYPSIVNASDKDGQHYVFECEGLL